MNAERLRQLQIIVHQLEAIHLSLEGIADAEASEPRRHVAPNEIDDQPRSDLEQSAIDLDNVRNDLRRLAGL